MVFSSASFLIFFLPCLLVLYFLVPRRCRYLRNLVLLAFSLAFYACGGPKFLLLMLLSIAINYAGGLLAGPAHRPRTRRLGMTLAVVLGLALLGWFKYAGFFGEMLHALLPVVPVPQVTLPIGISFFTFQGLSYVIALAATPQRDLTYSSSRFTSPSFRSSSPVPSLRYTTVAEEIDERHESVSEFSAGAVRFLFGLGKRCCWRTPWRGSRMRPLPPLCPRCSSRGWARWRTPSRSTSIFLPIPIWPSASGECSASTFWRISITPMSRGASRSFGGCIFHFPPGFPRDYVYIAQRQPLLEGAQCVEPLRRLVPDRNVARRELEFHRLGTLVLCAARGGKAPLGQGSEASAVARAPRLRDGAGRIQLGALPPRRSPPRRLTSPPCSAAAACGAAAASSITRWSSGRSCCAAASLRCR